MSDKKVAIKLSTVDEICDAVREKEQSTELIPGKALADRIRALRVASGENKLAQRADGSITEITAEDLKGITEIGSYAFAYCSGLASIEIPNSVTSIGSYAFSNCSGLASITIPDSVIAFGGSAFNSVSSSRVIYYGGNMDSWCKISHGNGALSSKAKLYIKNIANEYELVTDAVIPDSVTILKGNTFASYDSLTSVTIGKGVTSMESYVFNGCRGLMSVTMSDSVKSIGTGVFQACSKLLSIIIPDSVTSIGSNAFWGCDSLANVTIGSGVTSISGGALNIGSSNNKATIRFLGTTPPTLTSSSAIGSNVEKILVPVGSLDAYKSATNFSAKADIIEEDTE